MDLTPEIVVYAVVFATLATLATNASSIGGVLASLVKYIPSAEWEWVDEGEEVEAEAGSPAAAAEHFRALRQVFAEGGQDNRVAVMDSILSPGLFGTADHPVQDIDISVIVTTEDEIAPA